MDAHRDLAFLLAGDPLLLIIVLRQRAATSLFNRTGGGAATVIVLAAVGVLCSTLITLKDDFPVRAFVNASSGDSCGSGLGVVGRCGGPSTAIA